MKAFEIPSCFDEPVGDQCCPDARHSEQGDREAERHPLPGFMRPVERRLCARAGQVRAEPGSVDEQQHDRADDRDRRLVSAGAVSDRVRQAEEDDDEDRKQEQGRGVVRKPRAEAHHAVLGRPGAGDERQSEHEQSVREQRAEDGGLGDHELTCRNREEHDEELREVPERRLEEPGGRRAEALPDRLGREGDDPGEARERDRSDDEGRDWRRVREVENPRQNGRGHHARERRELESREAAHGERIGLRR